MTVIYLCCIPTSIISEVLDLYALLDLAELTFLALTLKGNNKIPQDSIQLPKSDKRGVKQRGHWR